MWLKRGCDRSQSAAAVSNQRQRLLDTLSAFDQSCQRLRCLLCEQQKFMSHILDLEQADVVRVIFVLFDLINIVESTVSSYCLLV